jgi:hypothetical protein
MPGEWHGGTEVYGWFTDGFDTVDLQEAGALLVELSGEGGERRLLNSTT